MHLPPPPPLSLHRRDPIRRGDRNRRANREVEGLGGAGASSFGWGVLPGQEMKERAAREGRESERQRGRFLRLYISTETGRARERGPGGLTGNRSYRWGASRFTLISRGPVNRSPVMFFFLFFPIVLLWGDFLRDNSGFDLGP